MSARLSLRRRLCLVAAFLLIAAAVIFSTDFFAFPVYADNNDNNDSTAPAIGDYIQIAYNDTNGLPTSEANAILYSSDGYIWIGSYSGLTRYDSNKFTRYGTDKDSIMNGISIRTLFEDSKGRIWIGSNDSGVFVWENGNFFRIDTHASGVSGSIRDIVETREGYIIAATTSGVAVISENTDTKKNSPQFIARAAVNEHLNSSPVNALMCDKLNRVWAVTGEDIIAFKVTADSESQVYSLRNEWTRFSLLGHECNCIFEAPDGRILIGTSAFEMIELTPDGYGKYNIRTFATGECYTTNCIFKDSNDLIWLCSDTGIGYLDGIDVVYAGETKCSSSIVDMTEDYEGNLWFASSREGIMELVRGKFTSINSTSGLTNTTVNATLIYDGKLFVACDNGLTVLDCSTYTPVSHPLADELKGIRIRSLMADSKGNLWICTYKDYGIIRYKDGEIVPHRAADGLPSEKVRIAIELNDGSIAAATNGGVAIIKNDSVIKTYTEKDGFENPVILCLTQDSTGKLYCGSDGNGIYVIDTDGTISNYTVADGLPTDVILNLVYDRQHDCIWISCGSYLAVWDREGIRPLTTYHGGSGSIFDIKLLDNEAWILATTSVTIAPYEYMFFGTGECTIFTKDDGIFEITSNSRHYIAEDNTLYIATGNGVITINTDNIYTNNTVPKAIINAIIIDHNTVINNPEGAVTIGSDVSSISIDFSALGYVSGDYIVEYQLVGMDKEPIIGYSHEHYSRDYTNLRGGLYTFRVAVTSPAGISSEQDITLNIRKTLSFFEHPLGILFIILLASAAIGAVAQLYINQKTARLKARQERYRSITESALRTIAKTIDAKDSYTNGHSYRVAQYSREIAERMGWKGDDLENLYYTALVHDIGKIGIPDRILSKKGKLDEDEYQVMQQHPAIGYGILNEFHDIPDIGIGAKYHHERYDGTGYNEGLRGTDIPLVSRIIAVADAYDAMSTPRVYRDALSEEAIINEIREGTGSQFDPIIAQVLLGMIADGVRFE